MLVFAWPLYQFGINSEKVKLFRRNIPAFARFFDAMGFSHGELTNFSNIARECGVDSKTVKEYYQILVEWKNYCIVQPPALAWFVTLKPTGIGKKKSKGTATLRWPLTAKNRPRAGVGDYFNSHGIAYWLAIAAGPWLLLRGSMHFWISHWKLIPGSENRIGVIG